MAKPSIKQGIKEDIGLWTKGFKGGVGWAIPFPGPKKNKSWCTCSCWYYR